MIDARFQDALLRAIAGRGVTTRALAAAVGMSTSAIDKYLRGHLPQLDVAILLADELMWPSLADTVRTRRERACVGCGQTYIWAGSGGRPQEWCTSRCYHREWKRKRDQSGARMELKVLRRDASDMAAAIAAHCGWCQPSGLCVTAECALRSVSPLPLARSRAA